MCLNFLLALQIKKRECNYPRLIPDVLLTASPSVREGCSSFSTPSANLPVLHTDLSACQEPNQSL